MVFITAAHAQAKVEIGLKGGVNMNDLSGDTGDNITSYHGGAYGLIKIAKFGIQPEALFSKRGSEDVDLTYLDVPVMFKMYLVGGVNLQAGPQFGINLSAENDQGDDLSDLLKSSDFGVAVGAGADLPMGLNITARYIIGLSDIGDDASITEDIKSNTFQFSVGYRLFKLGN